MKHLAVLIREEEYEILILFIRLFCHLLPPTGRQAVVNTKGWKHRSQGNCQLRIIQSRWVSSKFRKGYPHAISFIIAHNGSAREHRHCVGTRWQSLFTEIPLDSRHYFKYFSGMNSYNPFNNTHEKGTIVVPFIYEEIEVQKVKSFVHVPTGNK